MTTKHNEEGNRLFTIDGVTINTETLQLIDWIRTQGGTMEKLHVTCESALILASTDLQDIGIGHEFFSCLKDLHGLYKAVLTLPDVSK
ncbi:MAG: hypothetical protein AB9842_08090 [Bacteroidales bacterium]